MVVVVVVVVVAASRPDDTRRASMRIALFAGVIFYDPNGRLGYPGAELVLDSTTRIFRSRSSVSTWQRHYNYVVD